MRWQLGKNRHLSQSLKIGNKNLYNAYILGANRPEMKVFLQKWAKNRRYPN